MYVKLGMSPCQFVSFATLVLISKSHPVSYHLDELSKLDDWARQANRGSGVDGLRVSTIERNAS